jgi:WD40 repeat protein
MGKIMVYNSNLQLIKSFQAHSGAIWKIKQSPFNNSYVASCSSDNSVKIWDPLKNWTFIRNYTNHTNIVYGLEFISEDKIASGSWDSSIHIWSIRTGVCFRIIRPGQNVYSLKILKNGFYLASGLNGDISIYNVNNGSFVSSLIGHSAAVSDFELVQDGLFMASCSYDFVVRIWDLTTYKNQFNLTGHTDRVYGIKQLTLEILATGSMDKTIRFWNLTSGEQIRILTDHKDAIERSIDLLNDGQTLVSGSEDKTIKFWNIQTGKLLNTTTAGLAIRSLAVISKKLLIF